VAWIKSAYYTNEEKKMTKKINILFMFLVLLCGLTTFAADRDTPERDGQFVQLTAGAAIAKGEMVAILSTDDKAYPAFDTANYAVLGRAEASAAIGATVVVKRGVFRWTNSGSFDDGDIGKLAYVADKTSVWKAATATNDIPAGRVVDVDSYGVWVDTYNQDVLLTATVQNLVATGTADITGAATVGGTLGVTGVTTLSGATRSLVKSTEVITATTVAVTSAHYGKTLLINTNAAVAITLPANGAAAGSWLDVIVIGSDDCVPTIAAATADTLITANDAAADSVTFGTGHRIGAACRFISTGSFWVAINIGSTTMTVTTN
jgi:hypothetical protein